MKIAIKTAFAFALLAANLTVLAQGEGSAGCYKQCGYGGAVNYYQRSSPTCGGLVCSVVTCNATGPTCGSYNPYNDSCFYFRQCYPGSPAS